MPHWVHEFEGNVPVKKNNWKVIEFDFFKIFFELLMPLWQDRDRFKRGSTCSMDTAFAYGVPALPLCGSPDSHIAAVRQKPCILFRKLKKAHLKTFHCSSQKKSDEIALWPFTFFSDGGMRIADSLRIEWSYEVWSQPLLNTYWSDNCKTHRQT